jgi:hypothetical protein
MWHSQLIRIFLSVRVYVLADDWSSYVMRSHSIFVMPFSIRGCVTVLTISALMTGMITYTFGSLLPIDVKPTVDNSARDDAAIISLRQQAASALASLQDTSNNHR